LKEKGEMMKFVLFMFLFLTLSVLPVQAAENFSDSLTGLSKVNVVVDLNQSKSNLLDLRLKLIKQTYVQIKETGKTPDFVVAIRGGASVFMTKSDKYVDSSDAGLKKIIHERIKEMTKMGIRFQQCDVALNLLHIDSEDIIPEIEVVANGYVTLIGYQNKGYALLPME
jgi:intracellular sulfur oxidation DsrE/DsrF family protein